MASCGFDSSLDLVWGKFAGMGMGSSVGSMPNFSAIIFMLWCVLLREYCLVWVVKGILFGVGC